MKGARFFKNSSVKKACRQAFVGLLMAGVFLPAINKGYAGEGTTVVLVSLKGGGNTSAYIYAGNKTCFVTATDPNPRVELNKALKVWFRFEDQLKKTPPHKYYKVKYTLGTSTGICPAFTPVILNQELRIDIQGAGMYTDRSMNYYTGASANNYNIRVDSVIYSDNGTTWFIANPLTDLNEDFLLTVESVTDRYYDIRGLSPAIPTHLSNTFTSPCSGGNVTSDNYLTVNWSNSIRAETHDLEWLFIDLGPDASYTYTDPVDWRNATRVNVAANSYKIPLAYPRGIIAYRIRGVSYHVDNVAGGSGQLVPHYTAWSHTNNTTLPAAVNLFKYCGLENDMNWDYTGVYTENGVTGENLNFYDGALKNRQSVGFVNTDKTIAIGENIYDHLGRPTVSLLPGFMPNTSSDGLKFYGAGINDNYDKLNFDTDNKIATGADALSNGITGEFYSGSNPFYGLAGYEAQSYIPDAGGFPFAQVRYMNDGSGRVHSVGGTGPDQQLVPGGHTSRFFYGSPAGQEELDRLFGNEVGFVNHYTKNIVQDANGQVYVSYNDQYGRTIATALAGPPENTPALLGLRSADENYLTPVTMNVDFLNSNNILGPDGTSTISEKNILISQPSTTYSFTYSLNEIDFCNDCLLAELETQCYDCKYKLSIKVIDLETNAEVPVTVVTPSGGTFPMSLTGTASPHITFHVTFPNIGSYKVIKVLELDHTSFNTTLNTLATLLMGKKETYKNDYIDFYLHHTGTAPEDFSSSCIGYEINPQPCYTCEEICENAYRYMLRDTTGAPVKYTATGGGVDNGDTVYVYYGNNAPNGSNLWIPNNTNFPGAASFPLLNLVTVPGAPNIPDLVTAIATCQAACAVTPEINLTECDLRLQLLKKDMSPGGQYFDNTPNKYGPDGYTEVANYETTVRNAWVMSLAPNPFALGLPHISWNNLRDNWVDTFANVLVKYHPEYCAYNFYCEQDFGSAGTNCQANGGYTSTHIYDQLMNNTHDDASAITLGLFDPVKPSYAPDIAAYDFPDACKYDPYVESITGANTVMGDYLLNFIPCSTCTGGNISIWELISDPNNVRLKTIPDPNYPDDVINLFKSLHGNNLAGNCGLLINPSSACSTPVVTQITRFAFFRSVYQAKKRELMQGYFDNWAQTNCNAGNEIYSYSTCAPGCDTSVLDVCEAAFLSCHDFDQDFLTDPSGNLGNYSIHYPYIEFDAMNAAGLTSPASCASRSIEVASKWMYQLDQQFIGCNNTPIAYADQVIIRNYLRKIAQAYCEKGLDLQDPNIVYPLAAPAFNTPDYGWGVYTITPGTSLFAAVEAAVDLLETNTSNTSCPDMMILTSYPGVSPTDPPVTDNAPCACNLLGEFIQGNAPLLSMPVAPYNPFNMVYTGAIATGFEDYDVSAIVTAFNTFVGNPGYTYTYADMLEMADHCSKNKSFVTDPLTDKWTFFITKFRCNPPVPTPYVLTCEEQNIIIAIENADNRFIEDLTNLVTQLRTGYRTKCFENILSREKMLATYDMLEYHYTLSYYDQAGNLIKTVPPEGVNIITNATELDEIATFRLRNHQRVSVTTGQDYTDYSDTSGGYTNGGTAQTFTWPAHKRITNYRYNSLNQLTEQFTPDGAYTGTGGYPTLTMTRSVFFYDALGRLVVSQNAKQKDNSKYTYTLYDGLGRMHEVGEVNFIAGTPTITQAFTSKPPASPGAATDLETAIENSKANKTEITKTFYDEQQTFVQVSAGVGRISQTNLRNRVVSVAIYENIPIVSGNVDWQYYDNATHYSYDMHGNVKAVTQDFPFLNVFGKRFLTTTYNYDLVSGNVKNVKYQENYQETFQHKYVYDKDNRLSMVSTFTHALINFTNNKDALYSYYLHGPLQRTELGDRQVQGLDYAYTLQGWLKGMNSSELVVMDDMGRDAYKQTGAGSAYAPHANFAADAAGFTLTYHQGDYTQVNTSHGVFNADIWGKDYGNAVLPTSGTKGLYNGNIVAMTTALRKSYDASTNPNVTALPVHGMAFQYDQLNRLREAKSYIKNLTNNFYDITSLSWPSTSSGVGKYNSSYTYSMDGDLKTLKRYGVNGVTTTLMDDFTYVYNTDKHQLNRVTDAVVGSPFTEDMESGQTTNNYQYDKIGNLTSDTKEGISAIAWNLYGKVKSVTKTGTQLKFYYNAMGQRVVKEVKIGDGTSDYEIYAYDANGIVMSIYSLKWKTSKYELRLAEQPIYGSSRLGEYKPDTAIVTCPTCTASVTAINNVQNSINVVGSRIKVNDVSIYKAPRVYTYTENGSMKRTLGKKQYEITNHLGNVLAVILDRKMPFKLPGNSTVNIDYYLPQVVSHSDYYPYGMAINSEGRTGNADKYRFGFNGQEKDNEIYGTGNSYTAEYWNYDPRLGRRWNVDPLSYGYPEQSPYVTFNDNPVYYADPLGLEGGPGGGDDPKAQSKEKIPTSTGDAIQSGAVQGAKNFGIGVALTVAGPFGMLFRATMIGVSMYNGQYDEAAKGYIGALAPGVTTPGIGGINTVQAYYTPDPEDGPPLTPEDRKNLAIKAGMSEAVNYTLNAGLAFVGLGLGSKISGPAAETTPIIKNAYEPSPARTPTTQSTRTATPRTTFEEVISLSSFENILKNKGSAIQFSNPASASATFADLFNGFRKYTTNYRTDKTTGATMFDFEYNMNEKIGLTTITLRRDSKGGATISIKTVNNAQQIVIRFLNK